MKFGERSILEAEGTILAHSQRLGSKIIKKGHVLTATDINKLIDSGIKTVVVAQLEDEDIGENEAAGNIAKAAAGLNTFSSTPYTGRVNLSANKRGLVVLDKTCLNLINQIDESITIAVVPSFELVEVEQTIATIKIIPFAISNKVCTAAVEVASNNLQGEPPIRIAPLVQQKVGLIQTVLSATKESVLDKTSKVTASRLRFLDSDIALEIRCEHDVNKLQSAIREILQTEVDLILISGASAITDRRDIIPEAITNVGGSIDHFGMPVDPGNLLLLAHLDTTPIIGLPGCARSPKFNGFDLVLRRLAARLSITSADIMDMGVGGLLADIPSRPLPRSILSRFPSKTDDPSIAVIVLAAGISKRMGHLNKLLEKVQNRPMVCTVVDAAINSKAAEVHVIVGHEADKIRGVLANRQVNFIDNPDYKSGLSSSLRIGIEKLPEKIDGVVVCLGDMPYITSAEINLLINTFGALDGSSICIPTYKGLRGNPVLWGNQNFSKLKNVEGDVGGRQLLEAHKNFVTEVETNNKGVLFDIDTTETLSEANANKL